MNIGVISTRLAGTDGVSLESAKIVDVAKQFGHKFYYCAGELDPELKKRGLEDPRLHFEDEVAKNLHDRAFFEKETAATLLPDIQKRAAELKRPLRQFITQNNIEYIIVQQAFAVPMQLPLGQAITEVLAELKIPSFAHNHDFYWERSRFQNSQIENYLDQFFPPDLPNLTHATINSLAQTALRQRRGLDSLVIPNVFDFHTPPPGIDDYNTDFRQAIGLAGDDWLILQPTRVVPRKGIELSIELLHQLNDPRAKLVITHKAGDEGLGYLHELEALAKAKNVVLIYSGDIVDDQRRQEGGQKIYSLWDTYPHANLVAYPSFIEGFGNALIETIYFRLPAVVNRYPVYAADIGPLGFHFAEIEWEMTPETVETVRGWLENAETAVPATTHNYKLATQHFSYQTLAALLAPILK
ncbi:glycosyltransferase [Candidatus Leptofilum sp.]|uniref:glycosyltransferase n=1 Tax=Candidatus Leptofilum sp. TaxID=3241576 RepID=UPI003B5CE2B7